MLSTPLTLAWLMAWPSINVPPASCRLSTTHWHQSPRRALPTSTTLPHSERLQGHSTGRTSTVGASGRGRASFGNLRRQVGAGSLHLSHQLAQLPAVHHFTMGPKFPKGHDCTIALDHRRLLKDTALQKRFWALSCDLEPQSRPVKDHSQLYAFHHVEVSQHCTK